MQTTSQKDEKGSFRKAKVLIGKINGKSDKKESDIAMLHTLNDGGSYVSKENLSDVILWITENYQKTLEID